TGENYRGRRSPDGEEDTQGECQDRRQDSDTAETARTQPGRGGHPPEGAVLPAARGEAAHAVDRGRDQRRKGRGWIAAVDHRGQPPLRDRLRGMPGRSAL